MTQNINKRLLNVLFFLITCFVLLCNAAYAQIGILNSDTSAKLYSKKHIGNYSDLLQEIIFSFSGTNIKYNIISENDLKNITVNDCSIIILPLIADLSQEASVELEEYIKDGGKVIIVFSDSSVTPSVYRLASSIGVELDQPMRSLSKTNINWLGKSSNIPENYFPVSTKIATIRQNPNIKSLAVWNESNNAPAVTVSDNGSYIGWRWGNDGDIAFNVSVMKLTLEALIPGIIKKEQVAISFKEFKDKIAQISKFRQDAEEFMKSLSLSESTALRADIQEHLYLSRMQENYALSYYQNCEYEKAQSELKKSRLNAVYAYSKTIPSNIVEGRTLWLDRGTIVTIKNSAEMSDLFDKIQNIGINLVYFETLNAGYTVYPSRITEQNPLTKGWDPLYWAIQEAHKRNIELHAWTWIFAAGNAKHNPIIGKSYDFKGPLLEKNPDLVLTGRSGNQLPYNQSEYWLDPSNSKSRQLVLSILEEIAYTYKVDGIQLDYIRYPFQTSNNQMGLNAAAKQKFEIESGYKLDKPNSTVIRAWNMWKAKQVTKFVQEASGRLRKIRPDIRISAAVFGTEKNLRMNTIQQDWETWVAKGWIDILNPMIYSPSTSRLVENVNYIKRAIGNKAFIYPGVAVRQLDGDDLLEQIYAIKDDGLVGNTLFAMAHLSQEKSELLSLGPYRFKEARTPSKDPLNSARILIEEFLYKANDIKDENKSTLIDHQYAGNEVIAETGKTHAYILASINSPSVTNIQKAVSTIHNLDSLTRQWLIADSNTKPAKVKFLTDYLKKAEILLLYAQHKQNSKDPLASNNRSNSNIKLSMSKN